MIVKMRKVYVAARRRDRDRLLASLRELGVLHLTPVDEDRAVAKESAVAAIGRLDRAIQLLSAVEPQGAAPEISPDEAAEQTLEIERESAKQAARLTALHRRLEELSLWGEMRLEDLETLRAAGVDLRFLSVPTADLEQVSAAFVHEITSLPGRRTLMSVVDLNDSAELPEDVEEIEIPPQDRPSIRAEAAAIDAGLAEGNRRLAELAHGVEPMRAERARLARETEFTVAERGGLADEHLFALQGWAPAERAETLSADLSGMDVDAAVRSTEPIEDDAPPTLIRYPRWARPIESLFDILGSLPGYKEMDLSPLFMVALPIFAAMLIGDGGYGLLFFLLPALMYKKACRKIGKPLTQLVMVIGFTAVVWGVTISSFFGVGASEMIKAGGMWGQLGTVLEKMHLLTVSISDQEAQQRIMRLCFLLGVIHLNIAHAWRALAHFPNLRFLSSVGWGVFLWGMMGVVNHLVVSDPLTPVSTWLLLIGGVPAILFASPSRNPLKMVGLGIANFPLTAISTLSDIISYVRLFAVGVASSVLAVSFNELAVGTGSWVAAVPILVLGHALNIILGMIALFAHGVRLNMLEFSNNIGMEWSGHPFQPFANAMVEET